MTQDLTQAQIDEALQNCAQEPVHSPGQIQPFGWLLAYDAEHKVQYASETAVEALQSPMGSILGRHIRDLLGREIWHGVQNALATPDAQRRRTVIGTWQGSDHGPTYHASAWYNGSHAIIEFEEQSDAALLTALQLQEQMSLIAAVQEAPDIQSLLDRTTRQLRHLTGFDRVMAYRFDHCWNGEIVAEDHARAVEPFLGLNFPSFDIPAQARAIMARLPLRLISDTEQGTVPIHPARPELPPLDITLAETRGTSSVHMQYLRNMGIRSTMTLSVVIDGTLWGMLSFHHRQPKVVPAQLRLILRGFLDVFSLKLGLLLEQRFKKVSNQIDQMQSAMHTAIDGEPNFGELLELLNSQLSDTFQACGFFIRSERSEYSSGQVPEPEILSALAKTLPQDSSDPVFTNSLVEHLPNACTSRTPIAGAAMIRHSNNWVLMIFRPEVSQTIAWAGDPTKTIEVVDGNARLSPRGSFRNFLSQTRGTSRQWTIEDRSLVQKLWPLLSVALNADQKRRYLADMQRQQALMIDELNHRVRNILALVQSISAGAKRSESSLESYSMAVEQRIKALAAVHSLGAGNSSKWVDIADILLQEASPYISSDAPKVTVSGDRLSITADLAPILALALHELMTNAAKYGALSAAEGQVTVTMKRSDDGLTLTWKETGGPAVNAPNRLGFGTTLIKRAVPYELGGQASLDFHPDGVAARIDLPNKVLSASAPPPSKPVSTTGDMVQSPRVSAEMRDGTALVVEDNFLVAEGIAMLLADLGFDRVETVASPEAAKDYLDTETPSFAILDVNLGAGTNSFQAAEILQERDVPMIFATGYGELSSLPPALSGYRVLTKPIDSVELSHALTDCQPPEA